MTDRTPPPLPPDGIPVVTPVEEPPVPVVRPVRRPVRPRVVAPPPPPTVARRRRKKRPAVASVVPLMVTLAAFAGMMAVSFGQLVVMLFADFDPQAMTSAQLKEAVVTQTVVVEGVDTVIVVLALAAAGIPVARSAAGTRVVTWVLSAPGLAVLLGFNLAYHFSLRWLATQGSGPPPDAAPALDLGWKDGWLAVLLICVQPAVVEELLFRYLLYGHLRPHVGLHGAVWLSAVIFGMAHLGNIPGWPVLIVLGAGLGYARAYSGGLALPIALHFLHNLAVIGVEHALTR